MTTEDNKRNVLEDLLVIYRNYNLQRIGKTGIMIRKANNGRYRANKPEDIVSMLTEGVSSLPVYVRTSPRGKWYEIKSPKKVEGN